MTSNYLFRKLMNIYSLFDGWELRVCVTTVDNKLIKPAVQRLANAEIGFFSMLL